MNEWLIDWLILTEKNLEMWDLSGWWEGVDLSEADTRIARATHRHISEAEHTLTLLWVSELALFRSLLCACAVSKPLNFTFLFPFLSLPFYIYFSAVGGVRVRIFTYSRIVKEVYRCNSWVIKFDFMPVTTISHGSVFAFILLTSSQLKWSEYMEEMPFQLCSTN